MMHLTNWIDYLMAHPLIGGAILVILVLFVGMVLAKLLVWSIISFILLVLAIAVTYRVSQPKTILKKVQEGIESVKDEIKGDKTTRQLQKEVKKGIDNLNKELKK